LFTFFKARCSILFKLCDVKEDTYYCHEHALEYLQKMKLAQRRHCKLVSKNIKLFLFSFVTDTIFK